MLRFFILSTIIMSFFEAVPITGDCTYKGVNYKCGTSSSDGLICNNLMMVSGNCLIIMCQEYNSCSCRDQTWTCTIYPPNGGNITLYPDSTYTF